jgi:ferredoxin-NADP reductase
MKATLDHIQDITPTIKTFWFKPERPVQYVAGQFTELHLPHEHADERGEKHWFTLSSSPTESLLSITTKFPMDRTSTFKRLLRDLPVDTEVQLADPMGDFVLPKTITIPLLFAVSGIGVTPVRSMIKYLLDKKEQRDITLLYAVRRVEDLAFRQLFESYDMRFVPIVKEPSGDWHGETGKMSAPRVLEALSGSPDGLVYLSGPEPMVEALDVEIKRNGVDKRNIVVDFFHGYTQL